MAELSLQEHENSVAEARASLAAALHNARDEMKPASLVNRARQNVMAQVSPAIEPLMQQTRASSGWLVLAGSAAAMLFALGRSSVHSGTAETAPANVKATTGGIVAAPAKAASLPVAKPHSSGWVRSGVLAGTGIAAGAFLASRVPLTESEKQHGAPLGRELTSLAKGLMRDHSRDALLAAVNSFGIARSAGTLVAILSAVAASGSAKPARE